jgi:uncharacterized protein YoaH (UPF0181 family)
MTSINRSAFVNDNERFGKLFARGMSKGKAARMVVSNTGKANHGGKFSKYEKWTLDELYQKAEELDVAGRAHMNKQALIESLRELQ